MKGGRERKRSRGEEGGRKGRQKERYIHVQIEESGRRKRDAVRKEKQRDIFYTPK